MKTFYALRESCEKILSSGMAENLAVKVGRHNQVLTEQYYSKNSVITEHTLFDMASVTKILAPTMLTLMAFEKKLLTLDEPVSNFYCLPEDKKDLTIRHLLTHTMGIGHKSLCEKQNHYGNIAEYILTIPGDLPIGSDVLYSCPGFILLGKILEKVYGQRLDSAFSQYIALPLHMKNTTFGTRSSDTVNSNLTECERGMVNDYNCRFLGGICGNAGLFSNMKDLTCYVQMLLQNGAPLIAPQTLAFASRNYTFEMTESRGLGFLYVDERYPQTGGLFPTGSIGHCGHTGQSVFVDPVSGLYVIILSDATISTVRKYGQEHYDEVMQMRHDLHYAVKTDLTNIII